MEAAYESGPPKAVLMVWRKCQALVSATPVPSTPEQLDSASAFALSILQPCPGGLIGKPVAPLLIAGAREFAPRRVTELANLI
jgi:hypothetical protein